MSWLTITIYTFKVYIDIGAVMKKLRVKNPMRMKQGQARRTFAMNNWYVTKDIRAKILEKEAAILAQKQKSAL